MAEYIYTRVSTDGQHSDPQIQQLTTLYPRAAVVSEVASGAKKRPMLQALVEQLEKDDWLIVAALDRLGRRTSEILLLIEELENRGVILKSIREGVDYSTPTGRLVTQILLSVAELERNLISERTRAGLEAARKRGRLIGRPKVIPDELKKLARDLVSKGHTHQQAANQTGISRQYVSVLVKRKEIYQSTNSKSLDHP